MESIKTKYDRVLLAVFGLLALAIGAYVLVNAGKVKSEFTALTKTKENSDLGPDKTADVGASIEALKTTVNRQVKKLDKDKVADLFLSAPVVKTAGGETIALLDEGGQQLRPPIENSWLYNNELDLTRDDIALKDTDGDGFNNIEEFEGKSNPRNRSSLPPWYTKVTYKECLKEPLSLKFPVYNNGEINLQLITTGKPKSDFIRVGDSFPKAPRFKVTKVDMREIKKGGVTELTPVLIITDAENEKRGPIELVLGETVNMPKLSALLVDGISGQEFRVKEGEEFEIPKIPGMKVLVASVTEEQVVLSFISPGKSDREEITLKLK